MNLSTLYQPTVEPLLQYPIGKGANLVLEAVSVWSVERYISVSVNTGVPFRVNRYFIYI